MAFKSSQHLNFQHVEHQSRTTDRENSLDKFKNFMHPQVVAEEETKSEIPARQHFEDFAARWESESPFGSVSWKACRGPCGGTVLNWLFNLKYRYRTNPARLATYNKTLTEILKNCPLLANMACEQQPFEGQTILHQTCAHGDEEILEVLLRCKHLNLEQRATGTFFLELEKCPTGHGSCGILSKGTTALDLAIFALADDEVSMRVADRLLSAGARIAFRDSDNPHIYHHTLLHRIARGRWEGKGPYLITPERTAAAIKLLLDPKSPHCSLLDPRIRDCLGFTAIDIAAQVGNTDALCEIMLWSRVQIWEWGHKMEYGFPLDLLDCGARGDRGLGAMQSAALYRHGPILSLGLVSAVIDKKWERLAAKPLILQSLMTVIIGIACGIVCIKDNHDLHEDHHLHLRLYSQLVVVVLATLYSIGVGSQLCLALYSNDRWFRSLAWSPWNSQGKVSIWSVFQVRNLMVVLLMLSLVLSSPWLYHKGEHSEYRAHWDAFASISWLIFAFHSLTFFELFKFTGTLAASFPTIFNKDMRPFLAIYTLLLVTFAVAMRIATVRTSPPEDKVFGSWVSTVFAFEESIHGPDVQWRTAVQGHPAIAGFIFVLFLWVTIVMMTVLIAMFTDTFEELREHTYERFLHRRALFAICTEKLMPIGMHKWFDLLIGDRISGIAFQDNQRRLMASRRWKRVSSLRHFLGDRFPKYMSDRASGATPRGLPDRGGGQLRRRSLYADLEAPFTPRNDDTLDEKTALLSGKDRYVLWHGGWEKGQDHMDQWRMKKTPYSAD